MNSAIIKKYLFQIAGLLSFFFMTGRDLEAHANKLTSSQQWVQTESKTGFLEHSDSQANKKGFFQSYKQKFKTDLGVYMAGGRFLETSDESSDGYAESGFAIDIGDRLSPYSLRLDFNHKFREASAGALSVKNNFYEYRAFVKRVFPVNLPIFSADNATNVHFSWYLALGLGALVPQTEIKVLHASKNIVSAAYLLEAARAGVRWDFDSGVFFDLLAQASFSPPYPRGGVASLGLEVGTRF